MATVARSLRPTWQTVSPLVPNKVINHTHITNCPDLPRMFLETYSIDSTQTTFLADMEDYHCGSLISHPTDDAFGPS